MGVIRIFLAFIVVIFHSPEGVIPKYFHSGLAVQCFFIISGFYMQLIMEQYQKKGDGWQINFYKSRLLRIFPLYLLVLITNFIVIYKMNLPPHLPTFLENGDLKGAITFIATNLFILGQGLLRFFAYDINADEFVFVGTSGIITSVPNAASFHMMIPSWSIDLELMFYLLAPFLLLRSSIIIICLILISLAIRLILAYNGYNMHSWSNCFFPSELAIFLLGSIGCRLYLFISSKKIIDKKILNRILQNNYIANILYIIAVFLLLRFYVIGWHNISGGGWNEGLLAVPTKYWTSLIVTAIAIPFIFLFAKNNKLDQIIGNTSYPIYLLHPTVLFFLEELKIDTQYHALLTILITTIISLLLIYLIESKIDDYRHRKFLQKAN